jgi:hypothetical protein
MRHELNPLEHFLLIFHGCNNLLFCYERQKNWEKKHGKPNIFTSLLFGAGGSVPLHIYGKDIIQSRWRIPHPGIMRGESFAAMARMAQKAKEKGAKFYIVHQPYRKGLYDSLDKVKGAIAYFDRKASQAIAPYPNAYLIKTQHLDMCDKYFADRTHLNDQGSAYITKYLAKQIDSLESKNNE